MGHFLPCHFGAVEEAMPPKAAATARGRGFRDGPGDDIRARCVGSGSCTKHFELRVRAGVRGEVFGAVRGREHEQPFRLVGVALL